MKTHPVVKLFTTLSNRVRVLIALPLMIACIALASVAAAILPRDYQ